MSDRVSQVPLLDRHTGEIVEASLLDGISERELQDVETNWMPTLLEGLQRLVASGKTRREWPQTSHWDWREKVEHVRGLLAYRGFAIACEDQTQGLMLVRMADVCRLPNQRGKPMVYIDYLETAPWNQGGLVDRPRYGGIGTVMLAAAIRLSLDEGFFGRIGLHSLPQSEEFYKASGMANLGPDSSKQGLCYFEMTPAQANAFLSK